MGEWDYVQEGQPFAPSAGAWNRFIDNARNSKPPYSGFGPTEWNEPPWHHAKTTSSLAAGTFSAPSSCTFNIWLVDETSGASPKPLIVATQSWMLGLTLENYWNFPATLPSGTQIAVKRNYLGKWELTWADCPP